MRLICVGVIAVGVYAICVGVIAVGVYAMTQKPKSKPAAKPKSALVMPPGSRVRLIASSR
ncbi:MAG: hypothetical protein ACXVFQ_07955 [Solirubrobacteraceae bacterium]